MTSHSCIAIASIARTQVTATQLIGAGRSVSVTELKFGLSTRALLLEAYRRELLAKRASGEITESRRKLIDSEIDLIWIVLEQFRALIGLDGLIENVPHIAPAEEELLQSLLVD